MHDTGLITTLAAGFAAALVLGLITNRIGLSPILGYLLAGLFVGPHSPGFAANPELAAQLAEVGVVLLMFGVGLHFKLKDLLAVKAVAIPGAIGQSIIATALGAVIAHAFGWTISAGIVLGIAISVASTVVLMRVLIDNDMLNTKHGHVAVGWLVVEDILTVLVLVMLPVIAGTLHGTSQTAILPSLGIAFIKLAVMTVLILAGGARVIPWLFERVARTRSRELFTLAVLVVALGIATGAAALFGASMALGAFLAGMVVGQSDVHHQAAADALPLRDAFAVLFFVAVGMLFDPLFLTQHPGLVLATLAVILIGKPLGAIAIVLGLGYPVRTALTVAIGLAQIGEFSFILADQAHSLNMLPKEGHSVLIAGAMISITINPLIFKALPRIEIYLQSLPRFWRLLNIRNSTPQEVMISSAVLRVPHDAVRAIVVGYGPVGKTLTKILRKFDIHPTIIDLNLDAIRKLAGEGVSAVYGDAGRRDILEAAGIADAKHLLVTLPHLAGRMPVIATARLLNPDITIITRARYLGERAMLDDSGASLVAYEEAEVAVRLAEILLRQTGASDAAIDHETERLRAENALRTELH